MKKSLIFIFLAFLLVLTGCNDENIYFDSSRKDMEVTDIKVYDSQNNEIKGVYKNITLLDDNKMLHLNSPAPVLNYYVIEGKSDETYTVKFYLYSKKGKKLKKIELNHEPLTVYSDEYIECTDITKENDAYIATLKIDNLSKQSQYYHITTWYNNSKNYFGSKGGNSYIKGVYFKLS